MNDENDVKVFRVYHHILINVDIYQVTQTAGTQNTFQCKLLNYY